MKGYLKIIIQLIVIATFLNSCESCSKKEQKGSEKVVKEIIDTVVVENVKNKEVVKIIYDTVFIQQDTVKKEIMEVAGEDPLPSWNDGRVKSRIILFVKAVTDESGPDYVKPSYRIATFDQEGTLWAEKPFYFQIEFMFDRITELAPSHPEWKKDKLIQAVLNKNIEKIHKAGAEGLYRLSVITQTGITVTGYSEIIKKWINTAKHPTTGRYYKDMVYKPMLELMRYLQKNDFKVFIVTEGGLGFVRPWVEEVFGIPKENVIGSRRKLDYMEKNGKHILMREPEIEFVNDKVNKVISIVQIIGKRPLLAFGNSDNDIEMLQWTSEGNGKRLAGLVHHTDDKREWAYDKNSKVGMLKKGLKDAEKNNWLVVDMKNDWKSIFPE